jgi:hypothetical protein
MNKTSGFKHINSPVGNHNPHDADSSVQALHHTLGYNVNQAAPGHIVKQILDAAKLGAFGRVGDVVANDAVAGSIYWLKCDNALYNIADYPDLYDVIDNVYGGDGVTNFRTPTVAGSYIRAKLPF